MSEPTPQSMQPYRPPREVRRRAKSSLREPLTFGLLLWAAMAVKVALAGFFLRPLFEDFAVELPLLTRSLLHPMASVLFIATIAAIILSSLAMDSQAKRNRLGRIVLVLGLFAFAICMFGLVSPMVSLIRAIS